MSDPPFPNRLSLSATPTPLQKLARLSGMIGFEVWIKRDDMTGCIATGGNKIRKLEFLLADAVEKGADCVVTTGGPQSNHARATAALAVRLGLEPVLVFAGKDPGDRKGNLLMDELLGARLIFSGCRTPQDQSAALGKTFEELRREGRNPYLIPVGGSNGLGTLGYVDAYGEYLRQAKTQGLRFDWIFVTTGSGGTQAGLLLGQKLHADDGGPQEKIVGISAWLNETDSTGLVRTCLAAAEKRLSPALPANPATVSPANGSIRIDDRYLGKGYGIPTPGCLQAIEWLAKTEGILLDPVYTGKTMAALLDYAKNGVLQPSDRILFWHTGGAPGLFARDWNKN